jgi:hypothetical protein
LVIRAARSGLSGAAAEITALSEETSKRERTSSGSSRIRCSITGTTIRVLTLCSSIAARVASGSKRRRTTIVAPRNIASPR